MKIKVLISVIVVIFLLNSGCIGGNYIKDLTVYISENNNSLDINETEVFNIQEDETNTTYSLLISAPEQEMKFRKNATITPSKLVFKDRQFFSISAPSEGNEYPLNLEFLQGENDTRSEKEEKVSHVYGEIKIISDEKFKFELEETDLPNDSISITNSDDTESKIVIEELVIKIKAKIATP